MGACNEPGCTADAVQGSTRCLEHRDLIDTEVMALGDPPRDEIDYDDQDETCWHCGGEGGYAYCQEDCCPYEGGEEMCDDPTCWRNCSECRGKGVLGHDTAPVIPASEAET